VFRFDARNLKESNFSASAMCLLLVFVQVASVWHEVKHGDTSSHVEHEHHHHEHRELFAGAGSRPEHIGYTLPAAAQEHPDCSLCSLHTGDVEYVVAIIKEDQRRLSQQVNALPSLILRKHSYHQNARAPPIS